MEPPALPPHCPNIWSHLPNCHPTHKVPVLAVFLTANVICKEMVGSTSVLHNITLDVTPLWASQCSYFSHARAPGDGCPG